MSSFVIGGLGRGAEESSGISKHADPSVCGRCAGQTVWGFTVWGLVL